LAHLAHKRHRAAICVAAVTAVLATGGAAAAANLVPHEAFYTLHLKSTSPGSTLSDVTGAMYVDWVDTCDGWSSSQRLQLRFYDSARPAVDIDSRFASWESHDGLNYKFSVNSTRNGVPDKQLNGKATLEGPGQPGKAEFTGEKPVTINLPAGTVFPAKHMIDLIDGGVGGKKILARTVFDGTSDDGPFLVNAVIAPEKPAPAADKIVPKSVNDGYRPMRLAFFNTGKEDVGPFYELSVELMDNGIARSFVLDYGDSAISADLDRIKLLEKPKC
jgi:envelope integrity protein B